MTGTVERHRPVGVTILIVETFAISPDRQRPDDDLVAVVVLYILFGERGSREFFEGSAAR